jgi:hypothetical protein
VNFINNIFRILNKEIKYQIYAKVFGVVFFILLVFVLLNLYTNSNQLKSSYQLYQQSLQSYEVHGESIKDAMAAPSIVTEQSDGFGSNSMTVENTLRYDYDQTALLLFMNNPKNLPSQALELISFVIIPIVFGIYGTYLATYDHKYKTIKIKALQNNWVQVIISKQLSVLGFSIVILPIILLCSYVFGWIVYPATVNGIPTDIFILEKTPVENLLMQYLLCLTICNIFSTLGFLLGTALKSFIASSMIIIAYNVFIPVLGKYDLKNIIAVLGHKVFNFNGSFKLFEPKQTSLMEASLYVITVVVFSSAVTYYISTRQSKYIV